jgi:hypothetical protein
MITSIELRPISAVETHLVRHPMLRHGRPIEDCVFEGDELESTFHLGAFHNLELIGVASAFLKQHSRLKASQATRSGGSQQSKSTIVLVLERHS